jgi:hypothetical protein
MFKTEFPSIDIQKKNPTLLYYPNSLDVWYIYYKRNVWENLNFSEVMEKKH